MKTRRHLLVLLVSFLAILTTVTEAQAGTVYSGTYVTPTKSGTFKFTGTKAVARLGIQGTFSVGSKRYPGMIYAGRPSGTGLVWYFLPNYETNANALLFPQTDGSLAGVINFYDKAGNIIDTGTARMLLK